MCNTRCVFSMLLDLFWQMIHTIAFSPSEILGLQHFKDNFGKVLQLIQLTVANVIYIYTDCLANDIQTILSFDPSLLLKDSTNVRFPLLYIGYLKCRTLFGDIFVVTMIDND